MPALLLAGCLLFVAGTIALLPTLLSFPSLQELLKPRLAAALGRPVDWGRLELSWREGVLVERLDLGDGAPPLRRLQIERLQATLGVAASEFAPAQLFLNLRLSGLSAAVEPAPAPDAPARPPADPEQLLANLAAQLQKTLGLGWHLPIDLRLLADIGPAVVNFHDPRSGQTASIEDFHFTARIPSLLSQPVTLTSSADLAVNGHRLPSLQLSVGVSRLGTPDGRLQPAAARIAGKFLFPGGSGELEGSAAGSGLHGALHLQPAQFLPLLQPFAPQPLPKVVGVLAATLDSEIDAGGDVRLHLRVQGDSIVATGGALAARRFGPLSFTLVQQVVTDHRRDTVSFEAGQFEIPAAIEARWQGSIEHPLSPRRRLTAHLGPVVLHLQPLLELGTPFLPPELPPTALAGRCELDSVSLDFAGERSVSLRGLRLLVDRLAIPFAAGEVAGRNLRFELTEGDVPLDGGLPTSAKLRFDWKIGELRLGGGAPLRLNDLPGRADLAVESIRRAPASRFGIAAKVSLAQHLTLGSLHLRDLELSGIEESLRVAAEADPHGTLRIDLQSFDLAGAGRPTISDKQLQPFAADLQIEGARVILPAGASPQVANARLRLDFAPGLHLSTRFDYAPTGNGTISTDGKLMVDAGAVTDWLKPMLPPGVGGGGMVDAAWQLTAKMPEAGSPASGNPLRQAQRALDLLQSAELTLNVRDGALSLGELSTVAARGIATPTPLRLTLRDGARFAAVEVVGTIEELSGFPGAAALPPQKVRLTLKGEQRNLASVYLAEELILEPAGLAQVAELDLARLDRLVDLPGVPAVADLLTGVDGSLFATLDLKGLERLPADALPISLSGLLAAGLRVDLDGGKQLRVRAFGDLEEVDLRLPDGTEVADLNLRLAFDRPYAVGDRQRTVPQLLPLSETVLAGGALPASPAPLLAQRLWQDLRGVSGRERSLTFDRVRARLAGLPLELSLGEGALQLDGTRPGLHYLQAGLLGGSMKARAGLDLSSPTPKFELLCAFSHLDTARLLPDKVIPELAAASEVTGEMALHLPLLDDSRQLLERLELNLHLWQIGSRTLERALFALDPYEQNEAIIEQRKMLRRGSLKELRVTAADGSLSTAGQIEISGISLPLPAIERLNLAGLPVAAQLAAPLKKVPPLLKILDLAAADVLEIGGDNQVVLRRSGKSNHTSDTVAR